MAEHDLTVHVSDNTTTVWITCQCGFETAFYTIEGDGKQAMESARADAERHLSPPRPKAGAVDEPDLAETGEAGEGGDFPGEEAPEVQSSDQQSRD